MQEPAHELAGVEAHHVLLLATLLAIILPSERNVAVVDRDEAAVADRDPMRVAGKIGEHLLGAGERPLGIDHPLGSAQRCQSGPELCYVLERRQVVEELKLAFGMQSLEAIQKQATEQAREHAYGEEEVAAARDPALAFGGDAATRHDAMDVRVMIEVLAPRVQHGGDADVGAEVLGVGCNRGQRLGRCREQQAVDLGLVLIGDGADRRRQREHDVEVGNW